MGDWTNHDRPDKKPDIIVNNGSFFEGAAFGFIMADMFANNRNNDNNDSEGPTDGGAAALLLFTLLLAVGAAYLIVMMFTVWLGATIVTAVVIGCVLFLLYEFGEEAVTDIPILGLFLALLGIYMSWRFSDQFSFRRTKWDIIYCSVFILYTLLSYLIHVHNERYLKIFRIQYVIVVLLATVFVTDYLITLPTNNAITRYTVATETDFIPLVKQGSPKTQEYIPIGRLQVGDIVKTSYPITADYSEETVVVMCNDMIGRVYLDDLEPCEYTTVVELENSLLLLGIPRWLRQSMLSTYPLTMDIDNYIKWSYYDMIPADHKAYDVDWYPLGDRIDTLTWDIDRGHNRWLKDKEDKSIITVHYQFTYKDLEHVNVQDPYKIDGKIVLKYIFVLNKWVVVRNDLDDRFVFLGNYDIGDSVGYHSHGWKDYISTVTWEQEWEE